MKKLYIFYLFALLFALGACKDDNFLEIEPDNGGIKTNYDFGSPTNRDFYGIVLDTGGNPISGATVNIGSSSAQTNSKGVFMIKNASVQENFAYVKVQKAGYINASRTLVPTNGDNRINIMMIPATITSTIAAGTTNTVSLPNGTKVKFDGSFKDANGAAYSGNVKVAMYHLLPSNTYLNEIMPGSLLATNSNGESRIMDTFGMLHVELTGSTGQKLQIADGHSAEITVAIDPTQSSIAPATIPLWSFNEATGLWQEDGAATKVGNAYVGTVKHFSWWNCDAQFPQAILKAKVVNSSAQPLSNVRIELKRNGQSYYTSAITDNNGEASGVIPANETLTLTIKNACGTVLHTAVIGPFTQGSTNVLPTITLNNSITPTTTITGTLKNCTGSNVTNGLVELKIQGANGNYFNNQMVTVTNGTFEFTILNCTSSGLSFVLNGVDYTSVQESGDISFTANSSSINVGNILTCTNVSEFITYQIDGQAPHQIYSPTVFNVSNVSIFAANNPTTPNSPTYQFVMDGITAGTLGSINSGFSMGFLNNSNFFQTVQVGSPGNNITLTINSTGPVGSYIDFTFNGTYTELGTTITHTISGTGHVKRDY